MKEEDNYDQLRAAIVRAYEEELYKALAAIEGDSWAADQLTHGYAANLLATLVGEHLAPGEIGIARARAGHKWIGTRP